MSLSGLLIASASHEWVRHGVPHSHASRRGKVGVAAGLRPCSSGAGQVAQHEGQDAAVPVVEELLLGIDAAEHLDLAGLAIGGGDAHHKLLPRLEPGEAANRYRLVAGD